MASCTQSDEVNVGDPDASLLERVCQSKQKQVRQKGKVRESDCGIVLMKRVMTVEGRPQHNNALSKETSATLEVRNKWQRDLKR